MKKRFISVLILIGTFIISIGLSACDSACAAFHTWFNAPLKKHMTEYYSDDSNYINLDGVIVSIDTSQWEIDITTENSGITAEGPVTFHVMIDLDWLDEMEVGDEISFVTAPMYFYNGHIWPVVAVEKDGKTYVSFEDGKERYLQWIEKTFG